MRTQLETPSASNRVAQSRGRTIFVLSAVIAFLMILNTIAIFVIVWQHAKIQSLHAQKAAVQINRPQPPRSAPDAVPQNPSLSVAGHDDAIPGRYKWTKGDEEKGIITLYPDHSFANEKGEKFRVYRWEQAPDGLVLTWQRGPVRFTVVESAGVYVAPRPNNQTERIEKVE
jgi:hypothetical protein